MRERIVYLSLTLGTISAYFLNPAVVVTTGGYRQVAWFLLNGLIPFMIQGGRAKRWQGSEAELVSDFLARGAGALVAFILNIYVAINFSGGLGSGMVALALPIAIVIGMAMAEVLVHGVARMVREK